MAEVRLHFLLDTLSNAEAQFNEQKYYCISSVDALVKSLPFAKKFGTSAATGFKVQAEAAANGHLRYLEKSFVKPAVPKTPHRSDTAAEQKIEFHYRQEDPLLLPRVQKSAAKRLRVYEQPEAVFHEPETTGRRSIYVDDQEAAAGNPGNHHHQQEQDIAESLQAVTEVQETVAETLLRSYVCIQPETRAAKAQETDLQESENQRCQEDIAATSQLVLRVQETVAESPYRHVRPEPVAFSRRNAADVQGTDLLGSQHIAASPHPAARDSAASPHPAARVGAASPRPAVPVSAASPHPAVPVTAASPRPAVPATVASPLPAVPVNAASPLPAVRVIAASPHPVRIQEADAATYLETNLLKSRDRHQQQDIAETPCRHSLHKLAALPRHNAAVTAEVEETDLPISDNQEDIAASPQVQETDGTADLETDLLESENRHQRQPHSVHTRPELVAAVIQEVQEADLPISGNQHHQEAASAQPAVRVEEADAAVADLKAGKLKSGNRRQQQVSELQEIVFRLDNQECGGETAASPHSVLRVEEADAAVADLETGLLESENRHQRQRHSVHTRPELVAAVIQEVQEADLPISGNQHHQKAAQPAVRVEEADAAVADLKSGNRRQQQVSELQEIVLRLDNQECGAAKGSPLNVIKATPRPRTCYTEEASSHLDIQEFQEDEEEKKGNDDQGIPESPQETAISLPHEPINEERLAEAATAADNGYINERPGPTVASNLVATMKSFLPLVVQQQPVVQFANGKKDVKVKALEAAEAARKQEERRIEERKRKMDNLKREKNQNKLELEKVKKLEEDQKKKDEERKKRELMDLNGKKRKKDELERKEREEKRRKLEEVFRSRKEQEEKMRAEIEEKEQRRRLMEEAERERKAVEEEMKKQRRIEKEREAERRRKAEEDAKAVWLANKEADRKRREETFQRMKMLEKEQRRPEKDPSIDAVPAPMRLPNKAVRSMGFEGGGEKLLGTPIVRNRGGFAVKSCGGFMKPVLPNIAFEEDDEGPTSYEMSPYKNSSEDEEEDIKGPRKSKVKKPIPQWASKENVTMQLMQQVHVDPDDIFSGARSCSLKEVFGTAGSKKRKDFSLRGNSGDWLPDMVTWKEELEYKKSMGYHPGAL